MTGLSLGIRLVIVLPTVFFLFSQLLRYVLKARTVKNLTKWNLLSFGELSTSEFRLEFFIEGIFLSIANGLILAFELTRVEYGVVWIIFGVAIAVCGIVTNEVKSNNGVTFSMFSLILLFFNEFAYFAAFGSSLSILGFVILPKHIFFFPFIVMLVLFLVVGISKKSKP